MEGASIPLRAVSMRCAAWHGLIQINSNRRRCSQPGMVRGSGIFASVCAVFGAGAAIGAFATRGIPGVALGLPVVALLIVLLRCEVRARLDLNQSAQTGKAQRGRSVNGQEMADMSLSPRQANWLRIFPPAAWLAQYRASSLSSDAIAGITLAAYAIPVSLAYAGLAGLPPQVGIYGYLL